MQMMKLSFGPADYAQYVSILTSLSETITAVDATVEKWAPAYRGWCANCVAVKNFRVTPNAMFGNRLNLRETCECECGLINRTRQLFETIVAEVPAASEVALIEHGTPFHRALSKRFRVTTSVFIDDGFDNPGGRRTETQAASNEVSREDLTKLSYSAESFSAIVHNDVLEHIPDFRQALSESRRVLRKSGKLLFTCPFFGYRQTTAVRAKLSEGKLVHLLPPEIHGDPMNPQGVLAWYNFGWDLLHTLSDLFSTVRICIDLDPFRGYTSNNHPDLFGGNMLPTVIVAEK